MPAYEYMGRMFADIISMAQNRPDGVHLSVMPGLDHALMIDNSNVVYLFVPATDPSLACEELGDAPAYSSTHPSFPSEEGFDTFVVSRKHARAARNLVLALVNNVVGRLPDVPTVVD